MTAVAYAGLPDGWETYPPERKLRLLATLKSVFERDWWEEGARPEQLPPDPGWDCWLILAGRGFGKTRTGSEWAWRKARDNPGSRGALVAPIAGDTRDVIVEGESGILAVTPEKHRPLYEPSKRRLTYPNGAQQFLYSADEPDRLRGPQHHYAWVDEWAAMKRGADLMDMLDLGLRLGDHPEKLVTTTPRPQKHLKALIAEAGTVVTRGTTYDNLANLAPSFQRAVLSRYEGTRLGRQELHAEILDDIEGALWNLAWIDDHRLREAPEETLRIVVAVDPAVTATEDSDETGIVVVASLPGDPREFVVLADASGRYTPDAWARTASDLAETWAADAIVVERNQGGDLVTDVIKAAAPWARVDGVVASKGKRTRAEPVAALYEQGRVRHVGAFDALEDQMVSWVPGMGSSPDRVDALVWGITALSKAYKARPPRQVRT